MPMPHPRAPLPATALLSGLLSAPAIAHDADASADVIPFVNDQLLLLATIIASVAALPALIDFLVDRRKRRERIALSLEDLPREALHPRVAGYDAIFESIADLVDRARHPKAYTGLRVGNEALLIGPPMCGKKSFALRVAQLAEMDRVLIVHSPRSEDVLARAKTLLKRYSSQKVMLLLPRIDTVFASPDDSLRAELDALIETSSERDNVLVIGTARGCEPDGDLDNIFGIKITLPGAPRTPHATRSIGVDQRRVLVEVAALALSDARAGGFSLRGFDEETLTQRVLEVASNPAEIEDIVSISQTAARHRARIASSNVAAITPDILETAIERVIPGAAARSAQYARQESNL